MRIGIHWMNVHTDEPDWQHMAAMQYKSYTLFEYAWSNKDFCNRLLSVAAPDAIFICRHHPRSEQKHEMYNQPKKTGIRHAEEWSWDVANQFHLPLERSYLCGVNEPNTNHAQAATNEYELWRLRRMNELMLPAAIYCFGVGHPSTKDLRPDTLPDWSFYESSYREALQGRHIGVIHEYWWPGNYGWGFWANRFKYCPFTELQWVVQECGIDGGVGDRPVEGWSAFDLSPQDYANELDGYFQVMGKDARIHSCQPFTFDFSRPWQTFDVRPMADVLEQRFAGKTYGNPGPVIPQIPPTGGTGPAPTPTPLPPPIPAGIIDPSVALAIMDVEAGGSGFVNGELKIRFEAHIFKQRLQAPNAFYRHFQVAESQPWAKPQYYRKLLGDPWQSIHNGQEAEWEAFRLARSLDNRAAMESISMGIAQIMGFNFRRVGYANPAAMFDDYSDSEAAQIVGFFNYILTDPELFRAVREKNWREIAKRYNGAGGVDVYAPRLEAAYKRRLGM